MKITLLFPPETNILSQATLHLYISFPRCLKGPKLLVIVKMSDSKSKGSRNTELNSGLPERTGRRKTQRGRRKTERAHRPHEGRERGRDPRCEGRRTSTASSLEPRHGHQHEDTDTVPRECAFSSRTRA